MIKQAAKTVAVVAASTVAIPYTIAFLVHLLHGWPQGKDKYKRALHPYRVYKLNYAVLKQLSNVRYIPLLLKWKYFYSTTDKDRLLKDIPYGSHENSLDIYFPMDHADNPIGGLKPVIVFVYGGTWGSGDKNMYGLLCSEVADNVKAIVICINYSIYPKGFVDDMVQDTVDCLTWVNQNIHKFGGDKERVGLLGHSAGAHLAAMAIIELVMKRLMSDPQSAIMSEEEVVQNSLSRQSSIYSESMKFDERHFDQSNSESNGEDSSGTFQGLASGTGSFYMVEKEEDTGIPSNTSDGLLDKDDSQEKYSDMVSSVFENIEVQEGGDSEEDKEEVEGEKSPPDEESADGEASDPKVLRFDIPVVVEKKADVPTIIIEENVKKEDELGTSPREAHDLLSTIKVLIGLAGVYHIEEHYKFETKRCVEDVSTMAKAMYGPEHFDRFSPTHIVPNLPRNTRLPPVRLLHGSVDTTVPVAESTRFAQAIWDLGSTAVHLTLLPGCGHTDICLDLMDPKRRWYEPVMTEIRKATNTYL